MDLLLDSRTKEWPNGCCGSTYSSRSDYNINEILSFIKRDVPIYYSTIPKQEKLSIFKILRQKGSITESEYRRALKQENSIEW